MKFTEAINAARLRAGQMLRERQERIAEKRAEKARLTHPGGTPAIWVWFLAIIAGATLLGSTWMLLVFIAGSVGQVDWRIDWRAGNDGTPARWVWMAEANIHALIGLGLLCACIGVAAFNAVWLHVRHHLFGVFRSVVTFIGIAVAVFMISGAIVVQQWGSDARSRDEVVATQTAVAGTAAVQSEIDAITARWQVLCAPALSTWQAQACRSGEAAWQDRIGIARQQMRAGDPQLQIIERAIADAREGDRMQARLTALRGQHAAAAITTVQAQAQTVQATGWMAVSAHWLEDLRKPFIAVLGELLAMTMFGVALAAHRSRQMTIEQSGWAREDQRIEDKRGEDKIVAQPMDRQREVVMDAETGEELTRVKPHWRKLKKGKKQQVEITPEALPDEVGADPARDGGDAGLRSAGTFAEHEPVSTAGPMSLENSVDLAAQLSAGRRFATDAAAGQPNTQADEEAAGDERALSQENSVQDSPPEPEDLSIWDEPQEELAAIEEGIAEPTHDEVHNEDAQIDTVKHADAHDGQPYGERDADSDAPHDQLIDHDTTSQEAAEADTQEDAPHQPITERSRLLPQPELEPAK